MRPTICRMIAAASVFLCASVAFATVRPPIQVRLADESVVAEEGRRFANTLEIAAGFPLNLSDISLAGEGWSVQLELQKSTLSAPAGEFIRIPFTATPSSDAKPLRLDFSYDGNSYTIELDLTPEAYRRSKQVRVTQTVSEPDAIHSTADLPRPELAPSSLQVETSEPGAGKVGRWVRVYGRFGSYLPAPAGQFRGTDGAGVYVMDQRFPGDALLVSGVTDAQGYFDLSFWWDPCPIFCDGSLDIYVKFELANSEASVGAPFPGGLYAWNTGAWVNYLGTDLNIGTHVPGNPADYAAPHFLTSMTRTWRWFFARGYDTEGLGGVWPDNAGTFYQPAFWPVSAQIHLSPDRQWEDSVISHEWGHHWVTSYASSPSPAYCNSMCDEGGCTHCIWCAETTDIAFTEGAPDWMGDVIPREYPSVYGGSISGPAYNFEPLDNCQVDGMPHDPTMTEGFFAALCRDIEDGTQDNHPQFTLGSDQLTGGTANILATIDIHHPTSAMAFLSNFRSLYPGLTESLWHTAKNCGYEIDAATPGIVTSLTSSHATGVGQVDDTVDFSWTRASDDCSGTAGYSISITPAVVLPDQTAELGNVTSYTSGPLAPGSYYFNIRAVDAAGNWSSASLNYGPIVILTPPPVGPDLAFAPGDGFWADSLVPRTAADANQFSVPAATLLPADTGFWWNARYGNYGSQTFLQASRLHFHVDQDWLEQFTFFDPGSFYGYALNRGAYTTTGGRHTLSALIDAWNEVPELDEYNNWFGHQYVYEPLGLTPDVAQVRSAPPIKDAGHWMIVDGSPIYQNVDGVRYNSASWWYAIVLHSSDPNVDYDLNLYTVNSGPSSGFDVPLAGSYVGPSFTDAVIVNHNTVGWGAAYDVGISNYNSGASPYTIEQVTNQYMAFNTVTSGDLNAGQLVRLWEVYLDPATMGNNLTLRVRKPAGQGSGALAFMFLDRAFSSGSPYTGTYNWTDGTGFGYTELYIAQAGYYGVVIQRDPSVAAAAEAVEVSIVPSPPDFQPGWEAMWWSPLVPRPAFDGTPSTVFAPTVLYGDQSSTYLNINSANWGYGSAGSMRSDIDFDGNWSWYLSYVPFPAGVTAPFNWNVPWYISAGRHTLTLRTDGPNEWPENLESNNHWGEQWIWEAPMLSFDTPVGRFAPPDPTGGWSLITSGEPIYYNVDAVRSPAPFQSGNDGYWSIVACMPGANSDVDLALHPLVLSPKDGLNSFEAYSYWGLGQSDFVIRNYNAAVNTAFDVGVSRFSNTEGYTVDADRSTYLNLNPGYTYGPFAMGSGEIVDIYEVYLNSGDQQIALYPESGSIDWGLSVYGTGAGSYGKSNVMAGGFSNQNGIGLWEHCTVNATAPGFYAVVVWKAESAGLNEAGSYRLAMLAGVTDAESDATPARTQIASIQPNPFNPRTSIAFDVASAGEVRLQIFDLRGRVLRTLVQEPLATGRHERTWNGLDDRGRQVASGVYLVQLEAAKIVERQKIVLVK